jgi:deoxyribonuclease (pyrimidine dimer)
MTRVNADVDPKTLHRAHLVAELREITMVASSLSRSLRTRKPKDILKEIPSKFTLNQGHVKFFYNKLSFLEKRFLKLADEMNRRGYTANRERVMYFKGFDDIWYNDWHSTEEENNIVVERITQRINEKPHLYKDELI